jgi:hypothetical protein
MTTFRLSFDCPNDEAGSRLALASLKHEQRYAPIGHLGDFIFHDKLNANHNHT